MKNKNNVKSFQIFSAIFVMILGTLLHFTFEWSNKNLFVGSFSAVNESAWEHLKLIFFPMLITIISGYFYISRSFPNFICSKTVGLIFSLLFTVIFFYTYTGILGYSIDIINILSFFIAVIIGEFISYKLIILSFLCNNKLSIITLIILSFLFVIFTFNPPKIGLFKDPISSNYGIF